jgi:hypothetical protein
MEVFTLLIFFLKMIHLPYVHIITRGIIYCSKHTFLIIEYNQLHVAGDRQATNLLSHGTAQTYLNVN